MSVEGDPTSGTFYIDDLNATYPAGDESKSQGDDHLRLIKKALLNTFPSVTAPVTASHTELNILDGVTASTAELNILDGVTASAAELNYVDGVTSAIQTQIDNLKKFDIQFNLDTGANASYTILQDAQFAFTIDSAYYKTASGSITINVKYDGTNSVTDLSAKSVTSTEGNQTAGATKTVAAGNTVVITTSSNSSATYLSVTLHCTRT